MYDLTFPCAFVRVLFTRIEQIWYLQQRHGYKQMVTMSSRGPYKFYIKLSYKVIAKQNSMVCIHERVFRATERTRERLEAINWRTHFACDMPHRYCWWWVSFLPFAIEVKLARTASTSLTFAFNMLSNMKHPWPNVENQVVDYCIKFCIHSNAGKYAPNPGRKLHHKENVDIQVKF